MRAVMCLLVSLVLGCQQPEPRCLTLHCPPEHICIENASPRCQPAQDEMSAQRVAGAATLALRD